MSPTERSRNLRQPLHEVLLALEGALSPVATFDPVLSTQTGRIAASDYTTTTLVWPSLPLLRRMAPNIRLALLNKHPASLVNELENGQPNLGQLYPR